MAKNRTISNEQIINMYQKGLSYKEMIEISGLSDRGIRFILNQNGIITKRTGPKRKHKVNEDFFKKWNNEMAWVLGLIVTDGYVHDKGATIAITQKDEEILKLVAKYMDADYVLRSQNAKTAKVPTLMINSGEIKRDLNQLGITTNKSRIVPFPDVPQEYLPSFVRGVIDGDGWVHHNGYVVNITSASNKFSEGLLKVFQSWNLKSDITTETSQKGNDIYRIWVRGTSDVLKLAEIIYKDNSGDFVSRKRERMFIRKKGQISLF